MIPHMGLIQASPPIPVLLDALDRVTIRIEDVPGKGRGVIAARKIMKGELIERAPVVVVPTEQLAHVDKTVLEHYVYDWPGDRFAVALGAGSIFNHSFSPNAYYVKREDERLIEYIALEDIEAGTEILVNYNGHPSDRTPLWFEVVD